jgi:hypothetical protein
MVFIAKFKNMIMNTRITMRFHRSTQDNVTYIMDSSGGIKYF